MSRTSKAAIFGLLIAIIGFGCFGGYQLYQRRYMSSDLKRTLVASMDPTASESDILVYIRDARLQIRTKKDAEVLQKFQTCIQLGRDSSEISSRLMKEYLENISSMVSRHSPFDELVNLRSEYWAAHLPVPKDLQGRMDQALADEQARRKQQKETWEAEEKQAKEEQATAQKLYKELRAELELPPLPVEAGNDKNTAKQKSADKAQVAPVDQSATDKKTAQLLSKERKPHASTPQGSKEMCAAWQAEYDAGIQDADAANVVLDKLELNHCSAKESR